MNDWLRVSKANKCPVCEHDSWCCIGHHFVNCMRVQSDKPCKNGGWLHKLDSSAPAWKPVYVPPYDPKPRIDAAQLMRDWSIRTNSRQLFEFSQSLGVSLKSLSDIGCVWSRDHRAWAFAMKNGWGETTGIRLRSDSGQKWSVRGSVEGIFMPSENLLRAYRNQRITVVEGPTDCCAALCLGFYAIGRPSCMSGMRHLITALRRLDASEVVIIADNDMGKKRPDGEEWYPGLEGAQRLSQELPLPNCIYMPPCKDIRQLVELGGTRQMIESTVNGMIWNQPKGE